MAHEKVHVVCENLCLEEGMTKKQIEDKFATKETVSSLASGSPKGHYTDSAALKAANPETGVYIATGNGHIYAWTKDSTGDPVDLGVYQAAELEDNSIHEYHLDNKILSRKIVDVELNFGEIRDGLINDDGSITAQATWVHYVEFECYKGETLKIKHNMSTNNYVVAFYNNNVFVSGVKAQSSEGTITVDVPANVNKAKVQGYNITSPIGTKITATEKIVSVEKKDTNFKDTLDFTDKLMVLANNNAILINKTDDNYISYQDGNVYAVNDWFATDYIELNYSNVGIKIITDDYFCDIAPDVRGIAFYDIDKNFISGIQGSRVHEIETTIPENARYIRLTLKNNSTSEIIYTNMEEVVDSKINADTDYPLAVLAKDGGLTNIFDKIFCIGDSLTRGALEGVTLPQSLWSNELLYSYPKQLQRMLGNTVYNHGRSGATTKTWFNELSNTLDVEDEKSQCYIIALGTNDIGYNGVFSGDVTTDIDTSDYTQNADTSVGWYARIIQKIRTNLPYAKIFCVGLPNTRNSLTTRTEANTKIKAICELLDCYFMDMQQYGVQADEVNAWKSIYYKGGHLNCMGYKQWSVMLASYIDYIIKHNPDDFWNTPFVTLGVLE